MPPRGHSSSSHSSSSHSAGSSSRSYSSRSSSSSSRSYSSHSSGSGSRSSYSHGPSSHSSSSRSSRPANLGNSSYSRPQSTAPTPPKRRPRVNQPSGFRAVGGRGPSYFYGRGHDYVYYPIAWIDTATGTSYEKGYYDENGQRYENVSFEENGKYENVLCHCPYCEQDSILNLDADKVQMHNLQCPNCGGPMEIRSQLDTRTDTAARATARNVTQMEPTRSKPKEKKRRGLIALIVLAALWLFGRFGGDAEEPASYSSQNNATQQIYVLDDADLWDEVITLTQTGDHAYSIGDEGGYADKQLVWDSEADSYYDADSDCWLWYNTDVDPAIWQYWYEGISSDFGDFGWMEHDDTGWYVEASAGNWIALPDTYDTDSLWYIID